MTVITMLFIMAVTKRGLFSSDFEKLLALDQWLKDVGSEVFEIL